jgi:hypothetical protein
MRPTEHLLAVRGHFSVLLVLGCTWYLFHNFLAISSVTNSFRANFAAHQKPIVSPYKFKAAPEGKRTVTFADALQRSPSSRKPASLAKKVYFSPDQPPALNLLEIHLSNESPNSTPSPKRPFGARRNLAKDESPIKFNGFDDIVGDIHRLTEAVRYCASAQDVICPLMNKIAGRHRHGDYDSRRAGH